MPVQLLNKLKTRLDLPLPGESAQGLLAPFHRKIVDPVQLNKADYKLSAVMVLFCKDKSGELFLPLIQRMAYEGAHSAQISFPGGKFDKGDVDLKQTAIRECYEEIGVNDKIELIGKLSQLYIPVSGFLVEPYVGIHPVTNPEFYPHAREVGGVIKLYINDLLNDDNIREGDIEVKDHVLIRAPFILAEDKQIWGATAMILSELRELIKTIY